MKKLLLLLCTLFLVGCGNTIVETVSTPEPITPTVAPTLTPTATPTIMPTLTPTIMPTPTSTVTPTPTPTIMPTPVIIDRLEESSTPVPTQTSVVPTQTPVGSTVNDIMHDYTIKSQAVFIDETIPTATPTPVPLTPTPEPVFVDILATPTPDPNSYLIQPTPTPEYIYDIILFWGQSNMNAWPQTNAMMPPGFEDRHQYALDSGIDEDILNWTISTSRVDVPLVPDSAYWYRYLTNSFEPMVSGNPICGEGFYEANPRNDDYVYSYGGLKYNPATGKLEQYYTGEPYVSIQTSPNQNMIPEFCRTYYELTGHKVIAVTCAVGGAPIQCFLPSTDPNNHYNRLNMQHHYMYEGLVEYFNSAVNAAQQAGMQISGRYWVCFQGEGNYDEASLSGEYYDRFIEVKNNMARDIGTTLGAIVEVSSGVGDPYCFSAVSCMHAIQERLINENPDIILGSDFDWKNYVPTEEEYYSDAFVTTVYVDAAGNKISYDEALRRAKLLTSYEYNFYQTDTNNKIHLLSCTLSQIGRECARSIAKEVLE